MPKITAYLRYQDLGKLRRLQATHLFLQHYFEFHEQQYAMFKGASVFKPFDSDLRGIFTIVSGNPSSDADTGGNVARNTRIDQIIGTLVDEYGAVAFR